ncbi:MULTISPECIES: hypothetical protein [Methylorubrum]|uniref:hypothetical protein n=1 Tax=Methylorubrum TaxID=2282523 RepID=UPI0020A15FB5|nr:MULTISPECIES: hypothetical protein [Methylorubrum]MCP1550650.1 hypothetical protein [Methylorubrum zatmanii]MCP1552737.1 hypothetical protein [Methylorubrum extorquens]MCP1580953.1 hypothetical protein [Methylorubrum extorquens]
MKPAATPEALEQAPYVLLKRGLFERPDHHGYTGVLRHAGRFSYKEASAYSGHGDGVTMMPASEAPDYSPACWHETQVEDLLDLLRIEREAKDSALADLQRVEAERDEADRRAGAAEREAESDREGTRKRNSWLHQAKLQAGYSTGVSFDKVWAETLEKAGRADTATAEAASLRAEVEAKDKALKEIVGAQHRSSSDSEAVVRMVRIARAARAATAGEG